MSTDPRISKHFKLYRFEIKSIPPGSQIWSPNVITIHSRSALFNSCTGKDGIWCSLKSVLTLQTLMLATLAKWAATSDWVFLGLKCIWTLLPISMRLQMAITQFYHGVNIRACFASLKHVGDLHICQGFVMPPKAPCRRATFFKTTLKSISVWWYFILHSIHLTCCVSCHNKHNLFPRFLLYVLFSSDLEKDG